MKERNKTITAFLILGLVIVITVVLSMSDHSTDDLVKNDPYRLGVSISGIVFLVMLFIPNIYWAKKALPDGYEEEVKTENRILVTLERVGEVLVSVCLLIFPAIDPYIIKSPEGISFEWRIIFWFTAFILMFLYEGYWIRYFRSSGTLKDMYSSFAGFPLAGATLPVLAVLFLGMYSGNLILLFSGVILGIGHIGIHLMHYQNLQKR